LPEFLDFEDLAQLDGTDLRAVFSQVPAAQVLSALAGTSPGLRRQLLMKLSHVVSTRLKTDLESHGPITPADARIAQRALLDALCHLSRGGLIAFDSPEDMVA
jgi:flagellar motor switch protein FliG